MIFVVVVAYRISNGTVLIPSDSFFPLHIYLYLQGRQYRFCSLSY